MKIKTAALAFILFSNGLIGAELQFKPGELWPDDKGVHINAHGGGILRHGDTYYWFGEHKIQGPAGNTAQVGVHVYSSLNLHEWKDRGIALKVSEDPASELAKGCILERPKVIFNERTKKFVMWFHLETKGMGYNAARSGVAVADAVEGPYAYLGSFRPNAGIWPLNVPESEKRPPTPDPEKKRVFQRDFQGGQMARDMTLFVDDDGKAYHIYASEENSTLQISQLSDDYLKPAGRYIRIFSGDFNEAPVLFKKSGKYFLISSGCSGWNPNAARLAVSDSVLGSWTKLGNPVRGNKHETSTTFESQSTHVLPAPGHPGEFIFMGDRWRPGNPIDGRYIWLPIRWEGGIPKLEWFDRWDLSVFDTAPDRVK